MQEAARHVTSFQGCMSGVTGTLDGRRQPLRLLVPTGPANSPTAARRCPIPVIIVIFVWGWGSRFPASHTCHDLPNAQA